MHSQVQYLLREVWQHTTTSVTVEEDRLREELRPREPRKSAGGQRIFADWGSTGITAEEDRLHEELRPRDRLNSEASVRAQVTQYDSR